MKKILLLTLLSFLSFLCCNKKESTATKPTAIQKIPFTPPQDSTISKEQIRKWLYCTGLLDSLSYLFSDSLKTDNPAKHLTYQKRFINAQDTICIKHGLLGGYEEYMWISQHVGLEKNRHLLDSVDNSRFSE